MGKTTEGERASALGEPHIHDLDFLTRLINDADRLAEAEALLRKVEKRIGPIDASGSLRARIKKFLSGRG